MVIQAWAPVVGGAQRQLEQLLGPLRARGAEIVVVTRRPDGPPVEDADPHVVRVGAGWETRGASARFVAGAGRATVALRPDVVHAHDLLSAAAAALPAARLARAPLVAKVASVGPGGDLDVLLRRRGGRPRWAALRHGVDAFACVAPEVVADLGAHGVPASRCAQIANGVDLARFAPAGDAERATARARLGLPADMPLVVSTGRLRDVKRLDVLADACARAGAHLLLVGEGPDAGALARLPGVTVRPPAADVRPFLAAADVYGSASLTEGLSNAMLEAMACGVPVAAVPASGVASLLSGGGGVVAADPGADALADALRALLAPGARDRAGRLARAHVSAHHDLEATADRLLALYERLAQAKRAGRVTRARSRSAVTGA